LTDQVCGGPGRWPIEKARAKRAFSAKSAKNLLGGALLDRFLAFLALLGHGKSPEVG
jgi:hypothetical protein